MYHTIAFLDDFLADLEVSPQQPLERLLIRKGSVRRVQLKPYVVETTDGPVEVADLFFDDGTTTRAVPFAILCFPE